MMMMLKAEKYNVNEPAADCTPSSSINLSEHIFRRLRSNRIDKFLQQNAVETALFPLEADSYPEHRRCQCRHLQVQYVYIKRPQRPVYSPLKLTLTLPAATTVLQGDENDKGRSALKGQGSYGGM
ncbi:putative E3 ubiquitin-protein ligase HERC3 [Dissostichus eleginoides]|uniref:E3 ubiquitin-protein ligase HERC3 n=1 Tax=Dissostichus eleginoides TaxID=100907 RepID=A0AAD9CBI5_DISEL|nr:putative E3 ubiquitin-protein ligase HERC3 [Dissostichus eleginoides]